MRLNDNLNICKAFIEILGDPFEIAKQTNLDKNQCQKLTSLSCIARKNIKQFLMKNRAVCSHT